MIGRRAGKQAGMALPIAIAILLILSLAYVGIFATGTMRSRSAGKIGEIQNKYHGAAHVGITAAEFKIKSPDDPPAARAWSDGASETFTVQVNGKDVKVKISDIRLKP